MSPGRVGGKSMADSKARFQIRLSHGLLIGFGGLVLLAVATVLALGLWAARQNTITLLQDKGEATLAVVVARIADYLEPAEHQLIHLARQIEGGALDAADDAVLGRHLSGALAATPQVRALVFVRTDDSMLFALRREDGIDLQRLSIADQPLIVGAREAGRERLGLEWGELYRPDSLETSLLNLRYPIRREGVYLGLLAATVRVDTLSAALRQTAEALGGGAFVVYGDDKVLAHPRLVRALPGLGPERPLPTVADLGDARLAAMLAAARRVPADRFERDTGIRLLAHAGREIALLTERTTRYGETPWLVGVHLPAAALTDEVGRLRWAGLAGALVLLAALVVAWLFARGLNRPLGRLARAAEQVRAFTLAEVPVLPGSRFKEISSADEAFNAMVRGLRWFETYVPRHLVHRLVGQGDDVGLASEARELTVMFTDIAGFTALSERLSAEETAAFLNEHFALLATAIEAEGGTIDKFIGDSVMAFWGAPEAMADHAARACRAALAIRRAIEADNARRRTAGRAEIRVRIGLHGGPVVVGNIGAPGRINYTIVGDVVNTANRIESLGKDGEPYEVAIHASAATIDAAGPGVDARAVGVRTLPGRAGGVEVFAL